MCNDFFKYFGVFLEREKNPKQSLTTGTYNSILHTEAQLVF